MQFETLQKDMIAAMKARDKVRKDAISTLVSAAKKAAIDEGCRDDIKEELVNRVILKEMKSVKEQIDTCPASREDLLAEYQTRYDIFAEYAPQMMSAEEVEIWFTTCTSQKRIINGFGKFVEEIRLLNLRRYKIFSWHQLILI